MARIGWTSDIHLDRLTERDYADFKEHLLELDCDLLLISGDIAEGERVFTSLDDLATSLPYSIYFVLGNHDFYFGGFAAVRQRIHELCSNHVNLFWLSELDVVPISDTTCLIGVEGWGDGQYKPVPESGTLPRDFLNIQDLASLRRADYSDTLMLLGVESAEILKPKLLKAVREYEKTVVVTHVPPFPEVSLDRSLRICGDDKMPFYSCKAVGDLLLEQIEANKDRSLMVLCGHTHEGADVNIRDNLRVRVKDASYGSWWDAVLMEI